MIDPAAAGREFDAAFSAHSPAGLRLRPENDEDGGFLRELFLASFPLRDVLPAPLVAQQADIRLAAFRHGFPQAMRRIVLGPDAAPIGRIIVDWRHLEASHCVDIAVHPAHGARGIGTALLRAWIEVAAAHGLACTLTVTSDNPARALYARLGFAETPGDFGALGVAMLRPPGP